MAKTKIKFRSNEIYECSCCLAQVKGKEAIEKKLKWTHHDSTPASDGQPVDLCSKCVPDASCCN